MRRNIAKISKIPQGCLCLCPSDNDIILKIRFKAGNYKYKYKMYIRGLMHIYDMDDEYYQSVSRLILINYKRIENCYKIFYLLNNYVEEW